MAENDFKPHGELTHKTVPNLFESSPIVGAQSIQIDLSDVSDIDSAGCALLLHWKNLAHQQGGTIEYVNVPDDIRTLSELSNVSNLI